MNEEDKKEESKKVGTGGEIECEKNLPWRGQHIWPSVSPCFSAKLCDFIA